MTDSCTQQFIYIAESVCKGKLNPNVAPLLSGLLLLPHILPPWASIMLFEEEKSGTRGTFCCKFGE
jgi:hypothetical protein